MKQFCKKIPDGFRDLLFDETLPLVEAEEKLAAFYAARGFREVRTSTLEYFDVFSDGASRVPQESMYKLTDTAGFLAVLRPDNTTPMARIAATRLKGQPLPLKICYTQDVFRISDSYKGRLCELRQSGVEFIGASSKTSDLTCLLTAFDALDTLFGTEVKTVIELGHVGFCAALVDALSLAPEDALALKRALGQPIPSPFDTPAAASFARTLLDTLPRLFGGREVLQKAASLAAGNTAALTVLSDLTELFDALSDAVGEERLCLDLGLRQDIEYYTGLVFRGYAQGAGDALLSGGRYDTLLDSFGESVPATGFGIELNTAAQLLAPRKEYRRPAPQVLIHYTPRLCGAALSAAKAYSTYELSTFERETDAAEYARTRGIATLLCVTEDGIKEKPL